MIKISDNNPYTYYLPLTDSTQLCNVRYPTDDDISTLIKQTNSSPILDPIPIIVLTKINRFITLIIQNYLPIVYKKYHTTIFQTNLHNS